MVKLHLQQPKNNLNVQEFLNRKEVTMTGDELNQKKVVIGGLKTEAENVDEQFNTAQFSSKEQMQEEFDKLPQEIKQFVKFNPDAKYQDLVKEFEKKIISTQENIEKYDEKQDYYRKKEKDRDRDYSERIDDYKAREYGEKKELSILNDYYAKLKKGELFDFNAVYNYADDYGDYYRDKKEAKYDNNRKLEELSKNISVVGRTYKSTNLSTGKVTYQDSYGNELKVDSSGKKYYADVNSALKFQAKEFPYHYNKNVDTLNSSYDYNLPKVTWENVKKEVKAPQMSRMSESQALSLGAIGQNVDGSYIYSKNSFNDSQPTLAQTNSQPNYVMPIQNNQFVNQGNYVPEYAQTNLNLNLNENKNKIPSKEELINLYKEKEWQNEYNEALENNRIKAYFMTDWDKRRQLAHDKGNYVKSFFLSPVVFSQNLGHLANAMYNNPVDTSINIVKNIPNIPSNMVHSFKRNPEGFIGELATGYGAFKVAGEGAKVISNQYKMLGAKEITSGQVFDDIVMQGKSKFPTSKGILEDLKEFKNTKTTIDGNEYLVGTHATSRNVNKNLLGESQNFKKGEMELISGDKALKGMEDSGQYITAQGRGSPYFTGLDKTSSYEFSLNPFKNMGKNPNLIEYYFKSIERLPKNTLKKAYEIYHTQGKKQAFDFINDWYKKIMLKIKHSFL